MLIEFWRIVQRPLISAFILFHLLAIGLWVCPPFPLYYSILPVFRQYICYFGFWETWGLFSHPQVCNSYLTANVTLANGQLVCWKFPRMEKLDYLTRAQKERYREWAFKLISDGEHQTVRLDACRFIARKVFDGTIQPVTVQLVRHWSWIQAQPQPGNSLPQGEYESAIFTYHVEPEILK